MIDLKAIRRAVEEDVAQDNTILLRPSLVIALLDRLEAAEKDAARYRWIRHGDNDETVLCSDCRGIYLPRNERLDAAIDNQMELERMTEYLTQDHVLNGAEPAVELYAGMGEPLFPVEPKSPELGGFDSNMGISHITQPSMGKSHSSTECHQTVASPPPPPAEPAVEPSTDDSSVLSACQKLAQAFKTSPPPAEPEFLIPSNSTGLDWKLPAPVPLLSDEEIVYIRSSAYYENTTQGVIKFARAIEQLVRRKAGL